MLEKIKNIYLISSILAVSALAILTPLMLHILKKPHIATVYDARIEISKGWNNYRLGEYTQAEECFQKAIDNSISEPEINSKALYGMACVKWLKLPTPEKDKAAELFKLIVNKCPASEMAAWSMLALARQKHIVEPGQLPDYAVVRDEYKKVYERFPKMFAGHEAFIYMESTYLTSFTKADAELAASELKNFISENPDSMFLSSAWSLVAEACRILDKKDESLDAKLKAMDKIELDPTNPFMDNASRYWDIATTAEFECGRFDTAKKYYQLLLDQYPTERRRFAAKVAIARMDDITGKIRREINEGK